MGWGSSVAVSYGVGHRHGLDPALLWLWHRPAATVLIRPLAWEPPHAAGAARKKDKRQKKKILSVNSHMWLVATILDSTAVEGWVPIWLLKTYLNHNTDELQHQ